MLSDTDPDTNTVSDRDSTARHAFLLPYLAYFVTGFASAAVSVSEWASPGALEVADQPWHMLFSALMLGLGAYAVLSGLRVRRLLTESDPEFPSSRPNRVSDKDTERALQEILQRLETTLKSLRASR